MYHFHSHPDPGRGHNFKFKSSTAPDLIWISKQWCFALFSPPLPDARVPGAVGDPAGWCEPVVPVTIVSPQPVADLSLTQTIHTSQSSWSQLSQLSQLLLTSPWPRQYTRVRGNISMLNVHFLACCVCTLTILKSNSDHCNVECCLSIMSLKWVRDGRVII